MVRKLTLEGMEALKVLKALSSEVRLNILNMLSNQMMSVTEIAEELGQLLSTTGANLRKLEEAGLIATTYCPGERGTKKLCSRTYDEITIRLPGLEVHPRPDSVEVSMPVGNYKEVMVEPPCGLASETGIIGVLDDVKSFFTPEHVFAQLIWFRKGIVTYRFPNHLPDHTTLERLDLSMEICSEAPNFNEDWPSDITLWIDGVEIGTWRSPGDFGGQRGNLTPLWWLTRYTQYGLLKCWSINHTGSYIDGVRISDVTVNDLNITAEKKTIEIAIGNKDGAEYPRGLNLFGRKFGNYPQDIVLNLNYVPRD
ncbi:MAG TPA: helix-turn-helix domain-containing protein [Firmicutes bacterium]|nr:helix-turn-helix domain-containing protein [Bacillota bacterium]